MKKGAEIIFQTAARKNSGGTEGTSRDDWRTPRRILDMLNNEFEFDLDAAADANNAICGDFIDEEEDALSTEWDHRSGCENEDCGCYLQVETVFVNPPYSLVGPFVARALQQSQLYNIKVVLLIPAKTGSSTWKKYIAPYASEIRFITGRLKFELSPEAEAERAAQRVAEGKKPTGTDSATFDSAIVIFDGFLRDKTSPTISWIDQDGAAITK